MGYVIRKEDDAILEIKSKKEIKKIITQIKPYIIMKKAQANLMLEIINKKIETDEEFIEVCKRIDKFGELNDNTKRKNTSIIVEKELLLNKK
jgi:hypothetical protein